MIAMGWAETFGMRISFAPEVKKAVAPIPKKREIKIREEEIALFRMFLQYFYLRNCCIHLSTTNCLAMATSVHCCVR